MAVMRLHPRWAATLHNGLLMALAFICPFAGLAQLAELLIRPKRQLPYTAAVESGGTDGEYRNRSSFELSRCPKRVSPIPLRETRALGYSSLLSTLARRRWVPVRRNR